MARLTDEDKIKINELYLILGTYAGVARATGFSPATVKRYVISDYIPNKDIKVKKQIFLKDLKLKESDFSMIENIGDLCFLLKTEKEEIKELWEEMNI